MVSQKVRQCCAGDCQYDMAKQLVKRSKFLWAVDGYIKNAKRARDAKCVKLWETLKENEAKHVEMLKNHLGIKK